MRVHLALLLAGVFLAACATQPEPDSTRPISMDDPPEALIGTWQLTGVITPHGQFLEPAGTRFTIEISPQGDAAGSAACNNWNSNVQHVDDRHLSFGAIGFTRVECQLQHHDARAVEERFVIDLTRTMEWSRRSDTLTLQFQDGQEWELTRPGD